MVLLIFLKLVCSQIFHMDWKHHLDEMRKLGMNSIYQMASKLLLRCYLQYSFICSLMVPSALGLDFWSDMLRVLWVFSWFSPVKLRSWAISHHFFASPRLDPIVVHYPQVCILEKCRWSICTWKFGPCFERRRNPKEGALACASHPTLRCWWYGCLLMLWNWTYGFQKGHFCR